MAKGVEVLFEQNGSRITDFRRGQSLGTRDHIVRWPKPATRPEWMTPEQYADAPEAVTLREVKVAHEVLVTTLLDHRRVSKDDLSALYARRWNVDWELLSGGFHTASADKRLTTPAPVRTQRAVCCSGVRAPRRTGRGWRVARRHPAS
jgi:hypothetical protein